MASYKKGPNPDELKKTSDMMAKLMAEKMKDLSATRSQDDFDSFSLVRDYDPGAETSTRTRVRLAQLEAELEARHEAKTTTRTRDRLKELEAQLERERSASGDGATSTRTRDRLKELEAQLMNGKVTGDGATSTRTRDRLKEVEAQLAMERDATSTRTRDRLKEVEKLLNKGDSATSTRTRDLLALKVKELEGLRSAPPTSTRTREKMAEIDAKLKEEMDKRTSTRTRIEFLNRQKLLEGMIKDNSNVDVAFMLDCTGSMGSYISTTKAQMQSIIEACVEEYENKVRVGFVGYRDHSDGSDRIVSIDLTEDYSSVISFMSSVAATGGADQCEDIFGGLERVIGLSWKNPNRVLIHVGDAPQHGSRFHGYADDSYSSYNDADPRGLKVENLLGSLKQLKIKYFFGKINSSTDVMIKEFCRVMKDPDFVQEVDMASPGNIFAMAAHSIAVTVDSRIAATLSAGIKSLRFGGTEVKEFSIVEEQPGLEDADPIKVQWLECILPPSGDLHKIKHSLDNIEHKWRKEIIKKADHPFSEGAQRVSYHGLRGDEEEEIVIKEFKTTSKGGRDCRQDYIEIMETQALAAFMAAEFNKIAPPSAKKIVFVEVSVVQACERDGKPIYYNVEKLLPDYKKFAKWCNNSGYVNLKNFAASLDAFCHWTHDVTNGYLMVVDIQGVARDDGYVLTDPCIHCKDDKFGTTNFGEVGMKSFFKTHRCNQICADLKLKPNKNQKSKGLWAGLKSVVLYR